MKTYAILALAILEMVGRMPVVSIQLQESHQTVSFANEGRSDPVLGSSFAATIHAKGSKRALRGRERQMKKKDIRKRMTTNNREKTAPTSAPTSIATAQVQPTAATAMPADLSMLTSSVSSSVPSASPAVAPSAIPTSVRTNVPSTSPSAAPSPSPTRMPS